MPTKEYDDATGKTLVRFRLPPEATKGQAWLAGEFNDWSLDACPLEPQADGSLEVTLPLEPGLSYRFRYYLGDGSWENDWAADAYVDNDHGGADSVVDVPPAPAPPPPVESPVGATPATPAPPAAPASASTAKEAAPEKKVAPARKAAAKKEGAAPSKKAAVKKKAAKSAAPKRKAT